MSSCPHCQQDGISFFKKVLIGPTTIINCTKCHQKVTISKLANWAAIPFLLGIAGSFFSHDLILKTLMMSSGLIISGLIKGFAVPLVKIGETPGADRGS